MGVSVHIDSGKYSCVPSALAYKFWAAGPKAFVTARQKLWHRDFVHRMTKTAGKEGKIKKPFSFYETADPHK